MPLLYDVPLGNQSIERFHSILRSDDIEEYLELADAMRERLAGRVVWNINSTAVGGGVAEMLPHLLSYVRASGIEARWVVIPGNPDFFRITKRLHHALHESGGDGTRLGEEERRIYEASLVECARELRSRLGRGDIVLLHDPQTAGLAPHLAEAGVQMIWRCHIGHDDPGAEAEIGWNFLAPYLRQIPSFVFSRPSYVPEVCDHGKAVIIQPSIDAFAPKNQEIDQATVYGILAHIGLVGTPAPGAPAPLFRRCDGSQGRVERRARVLRVDRAPGWNTPLIVQISRWDPLKDPVGVMRGFAARVASHGAEPELMLAGPDVAAVSDDPEGAKVYEQSVAAWGELPEPIRRRIHLVSLPTDDVEENAAMVNALQRHATIAVQKSLQEGFGLTVTEAMWKARPIVASAVGGIQDQIQDGVHGVLLADPRDLDGFGEALCRLLDEPERAEALGNAAHHRARKQFLGLRHLRDYARLIERLDS